ncbi:pre-mRNA 3' end processing protein WDR33 [Portunus trituberculatus]|uniref:Pre-mRNA 3' end processing protein WDR33 n=1 Tax=Portunus trituberculatus TaxID=210409 RepID=A0A5B7E3Z2_PORTR|nr:pre-mRNA 3' end processing protein WDR33 [Portunus trituberculatus]
MIQVGMFNVPPPPIPGKPLPPPGGGPQPFQPLSFKPFKTPDGEFDGKRLRKSVMRKTVDYNCSVTNMLESRVWQRDERDRPALQADVCYASEMLPPTAHPLNPINAVVTKFVRTSTNKAKCPIFCLAWTPEGRRLVTGASSGEFTLWNGLTFNFETILQAHDSSVRTMVWSHNDQWMVTGDTGGFVKYWQTNMNNVKLFQAHKDPVRGLRYPHLCHRPLSIITVTTTTTHFSCPPSLSWDAYHGCRRFYYCRFSNLLSLYNCVIQSSTHGCISQFSFSLTFFLVLVCHIGTSSTIITLCLILKLVEYNKIIETMYELCVVHIHLQINKEQFDINLIIFYVVPGMSRLAKNHLGHGDHFSIIGDVSDWYPP